MSHYKLLPFVVAAAVTFTVAAAIVVAHGDGDHRYQAVCDELEPNYDIVSEPSRWHVTRTTWSGSCHDSPRAAMLEALAHDAEHHGGKHKATVRGPIHTCLK